MPVDYAGVSLMNGEDKHSAANLVVASLPGQPLTWDMAGEFPSPGAATLSDKGQEFQYEPDPVPQSSF